jgi:LacI family transcriptional regulator
MHDGDRSKPTIYDVAEHAGVAIATVSRVVNGSGDVTDGMRERVWASVRKLRYRPSRVARALAYRHHQTLAIAAPTFTTPFHNELLKGVRSRLHDAELDLLLCDLDWDAPKESLMNFFAGGTVDGLLLVGVPMDRELADEILALRLPIVVGSASPSST